ncbi:MAG: peptidoglycan DD-metalloendopeptidase family protein [Ruthenibacterium lactatiformans]
MGRPHPPYTRKWARPRGLHLGAAKSTGTCAAANGTVLLARYGHASYGNYVVVGHGGGVTTLYAHCSALNVAVGQAVSAVDVIAFVGSTAHPTARPLIWRWTATGT